MDLQWLVNHSIDDVNLINSVNAFDEEFGIKLNDPDIWLNPDDYQDILLTKCVNNITYLFLLINGIDNAKYVNKSIKPIHHQKVHKKFRELRTVEDLDLDMNSNIDSDILTEYNWAFDNPYVKKCVDMKSQMFVNTSLLEYNINRRYSTNDVTFRLRYISNILNSLIFSFVDIINNTSKYHNHSFSEYRISKMNEFMKYIIKFILIMGTPKKEYRNIILKMHEITSYKYTKINQMDISFNLNDKVSCLRDFMQSNILEGRFFDDDMAIYTILQLAYIAATNRTDYKKLPKFKYIEGATIKYDFSKLIEGLGISIIKSNDGKKYPVMFKAFVDAHPILYTEYEYECERNYALRIGILAIEYARFILHDKINNDFINKMLQRGIV